MNIKTGNVKQSIIKSKDAVKKRLSICLQESCLAYIV